MQRAHAAALAAESTALRAQVSVRPLLREEVAALRARVLDLEAQWVKDTYLPELALLQCVA
jgi:hypothetical protein